MQRFGCLVWVMWLGQAGLALAAPLQGTQTAQANGTCAVAINASGQAVVTVTANCTPKVAATLQKLLEEQAAQRAKIARLAARDIAQDRRLGKGAQDIGALQQDVANLKEAMQTITEQAKQIGASREQKTAAANLVTGKPKLAIKQLGLAAAKAGADSARQAQNAAALYRQQAALLETRDIRLALAAYEKALTFAPEDFALLKKAGETAHSVGNSKKAVDFYARLQASAEKALAFPDKQVGLHQLAVARQRLGDMALVQGQLDVGETHYRAAYKISTQLLAHNPANTVAQASHVETLARLGDVLVSQRKKTEATAQYQEAMRLAQILVAKTPTDTRQKSYLVALHQRVAGIHLTALQIHDGLTNASAALMIAQTLYQAMPTNREWAVLVAVSHELLAQAHTLKCDSAEATKNTTAGLAIMLKIHRTDPADSAVSERVVNGYLTTGVGHEMMGNDKAARAQYEQALAYSRTLVAMDSNNTRHQNHMAFLLTRRSNVQKRLGNDTGAARSRNEALAIARGLVKLDPSNIDWQTTLDNALHVWQNPISIGQASFCGRRKVTGDDAPVLTKHREVLALAQKLAEQNPTDTMRQVALAKAKLDVMSAETDVALQIKLFIEARTILQELRTTNRLGEADLVLLKTLETIVKQDPTQ